MSNIETDYTLKMNILDEFDLTDKELERLLAIIAEFVNENYSHK